MDEIYECMQEFYYDERVSELLKKIENNELTYFISKLYVSPDSKHICVVIDLLGTKKQYVCMYKCLDKETNKFSPNNVIFNVKPEIAMRNEGIGYLVQRN